MEAKRKHPPQKSHGNLPGYPEAKAPHPEAKALLKPWDHGGSSLKAGIVTYEWMA